MQIGNRRFFNLRLAGMGCGFHESAVFEVDRESSDESERSSSSTGYFQFTGIYGVRCNSSRSWMSHTDPAESEGVNFQNALALKQELL